MRGTWVLVLLLLLPLAGAQSVLPPPSVTITAAAPQDAAKPLGAAVRVPASVDVTCDPALVAQGMDVRYAVTRQPAWSTVVVQPASEHVAQDVCAAGHVMLHPSVLVSASDQAPAFFAEGIEVTALVDAVGHAEGIGRVSFPVVADYFSIVDVGAPRIQVAVGADERVALPVNVANLGNGVTKVVFEVATDATDFGVQAPAPIILQSRQAGGTETSAAATLFVQRGSAVAATPETFTLRWHSAYALDARLAGENGQLSFVVMPGAQASGSKVPEPLRTVPLPTFLLVGAAIVVAALARRRV